MFKSTIPQIRLNYAIDGQLITTGNTTWQTKNLTSVSVEQSKLKMEVPEPGFKPEKPLRRFYWGSLLLAVAGAWIWSLSFDRPPRVGIPLTLLACVATWFVGHYSHRHRMKLWSNGHEKSERQRNAWQNLSDKPPELFSLVLDSASGKSVALTTFKRTAVTAMHAAILEAMRNASVLPIKGTIEAVESAAGQLEKMYEKFCVEEISSA